MCHKFYLHLDFFFFRKRGFKFGRMLKINIPVSIIMLFMRCCFNVCFKVNIAATLADCMENTVMQQNKYRQSFFQQVWWLEMPKYSNKKQVVHFPKVLKPKRSSRTEDVTTETQFLQKKKYFTKCRRRHNTSGIVEIHKIIKKKRSQIMSESTQTHCVIYRL